MEGIPNNTFATGGPAPSAPPPPPEVKVRTMRSDLAAMAKSGGGIPRFENVQVANLSIGKQPEATPLEGAKGRNKAVITLVIIAALALFSLLGYLAFRFFYHGGSAAAPAADQPFTQTPVAGTTNTVTPAPQGNGLSVATTTPASAPEPFIHASIFKKAADQTLILTLSSGGAAASAVDLTTLNQKIIALLAQANKNASVIEIVVQTEDHHGVPIGDLFIKENAPILSAQFLNEHFNADATFFVYKDKNGNWPAYVLSLKPSENWLFLKSDVAKLESSPDLPNIFLSNVGAANGVAFADGTASTTAVRVGTYAASNPPASFVYGWYKNYLILSTSQNGFVAALERL